RMIDAPAARHAEMEDHRVGAVGVNQPIFGAAAEVRDGGARQPLAKVLGKGPTQIGSPHFDARDSVSLEDALKPTNRGFEFGKFGHGDAIWRTLRKLSRAAHP